MYNHAQKWGPPPPPPPLNVGNPMEQTTQWFVDVPSISLAAVMNQKDQIQISCSTTIKLVAGGDQVSRWGRLCITGAPIPIHKTVSAIMRLSPCVEAGYASNTPFPSTIEASVDEDADVIPVFHAAWTEYNVRKQ